MDDSFIITAYSIIADTMAGVGHQSHCLATVSDAEILTVAVVAAKYFHVRPLTAREIAPKELHLNNDVRTRWQASTVGNRWGLKPTDKRSAAASHKRLTDQSCDLG